MECWRTEMKPVRLVMVLACIVPGVLFGGLAYWFYFEPIRVRKAVLDRGLSFLGNSLWDPVNGCYREVPVFTGSSLAGNHNPDDNFLAYIFHTEYVVNSTRAAETHALLARNNFTGYGRWLVLSKYQGNYSRYQCVTCDPSTPYGDDHYADHVALDGIYDWKTDNLSGARERLDFLVGHMLDSRLGLLRDSATPMEGFVYYKLALSLILASELGNSTYTDQFSKTLSSQQNLDGSWLTSPAQPAGVYPNTETTILMIMALKVSWNL